VRPVRGEEPQFYWVEEGVAFNLGTISWRSKKDDSYKMVVSISSNNRVHSPPPSAQQNPGYAHAIKLATLQKEFDDIDKYTGRMLSLIRFLYCRQKFELDGTVFDREGTLQEKT